MSDDDAYLGDDAPRGRGRAGPVDPLGLVGKDRRAPDGPSRPPLWRESWTAVAGAAFIAAATLAFGASALLTHPPAARAPADPPRVTPLREVTVNVAAIAQARGKPMTWQDLFDLYGLEERVRERTLEANPREGRRPNPTDPIATPTVVLRLSG